MPTGGGDDNATPTPAPAGASSTGGNLNTPTAGTKDSPHGTKKYGEPLFGPSIGSVSSGPGWTLAGEKKIMTDELTTEIVNGWIEKSKEVRRFPIIPPYCCLDSWLVVSCATRRFSLSNNTIAMLLIRDEIHSF